MNQAITTTHQPDDLALSESAMVSMLKTSLYPDAADDSVRMVLAYCAAAKLDVMQKPVHIVPMWSAKDKKMRDVIMPGISLYRIQASRSGQLAGIGEPEFGPALTENVGGVQITYPEWCRVTVHRRMPTGELAPFVGLERWKENYAVKGGAEKSTAPNSMWQKRAYGQLAKCAEAQALRRAFPEMCSAPTAEEMEGKGYSVERDVTPRPVGTVYDPYAAPAVPALPEPAHSEPEPVEAETQPVDNTVWQELYPRGWRAYLDASGDYPSDDAGLGKVWQREKENPGLCAWAAGWIVKTMREFADMEWTEVSIHTANNPAHLEDCTPDDLWVSAAYLRRVKAEAEKKEGSAA